MTDQPVKADQPVKIWLDRNGQILRLRMARPKANIVDAAMIKALDRALDDHGDGDGLKAVIVDHEGPHFSFGASVAEHMPEQCAAMLSGFHALIRRMLEYPVPILVVVHGQCLGGGMEVAMAGMQIFASPDAAFAQPEIKVGVFAPAASCLLPERVGQALAEDILYSGRTLDAIEAKAAGLVAQVADDPEAAALAYFDEHLAPQSATVLRFAVKAAREEFAARVGARLDGMEGMYLLGLMKTRDAVEGLQAFMEKRPAKWENK